MKRDWDLMRQILFEVEKWPFTGGFDTITIPNHSEPEISYHVSLLADAGLIEAIDVSSHDGVAWRPKHLTYAGHEFLDAARQDTTWNSAKEKVFKATGTITLEAQKTVLHAMMTKAITGGL